MSYKKDVLLDSEGNIIRPCTVSDNVVIPDTRKTVTEEFSELDGKLILRTSIKNDNIAVLNFIISNSTKTWKATGDIIGSAIYGINRGDNIFITANERYVTMIFWLNSYNNVGDGLVPDFYSNEIIKIQNGTSKTISAPADCYMYVAQANVSGADYTPEKIEKNVPLKQKVSELEKDLSNNILKSVTIGRYTKWSENSFNTNKLYIITSDGESIEINTQDSVYTFSNEHRYLVLTPSNTVEQRGVASDVKDTDYVLLVYSEVRGFYGGALYAEYINATTLKADSSYKVLTPLMGYEAVSTAAGQIVDSGNSNPLLKKYRCTCRYVAVQSNVGIRLTTVRSNIVFRIYEYDESFNMVAYSDIETLTTSWLDKNLSDTTRYIKCLIREASGELEPIDAINIELRGNGLKEVYNPRPVDNGYQRICVRVNLTNPNACDASSSGVQDEENYGVDYGVLCLPTTYTHDGEATRLIIYCHGAAVNYADDVTRFNTQDLEPEYWLKEGYAVMDMEGNPYNNEDEHFGIPQAMECYLAAYKWVINHYNIKRDGVFLGGRSMGGLMTFLLCKDSCPIPVIAACPNVPAAGLIWSWEYMNARRRAFCAEHMGFVGTAPTWTSNSPMSSAEWNYLKANGLIALKNSIMSMVIDCPSVDEIFADDNNISKSAIVNSPLLTKLESCHMRVNCPIKQFYVTDDATVTPNQCCLSIDKMLKNAGMATELRLFADGGGHHYDTQNSNLRTNVTTIYGEQMSNVPVVYVEMLQFWRRYEQVN